MKNKSQLVVGIFIGIIIGVIGILSVQMLGLIVDPVVGLTKIETKQMEDKMNTIVKYLEKNHIDDKQTKDLLEGSYKGLVSAMGDRYTRYFTEKEFKDLTENLNASYAGIGVIVTIDKNDNLITVINAFENSPGEKAGILPQDKILKVNGIEYYGDQLSEAVDNIKGKPGTKVTLSIFRKTENRVFDVDVNREVIDLPTVKHKLLENNIGYIKIVEFDKITYNQYMAAYLELESQGQKGLIIDLRDNPGGLLTAVKSIADEILPEGIIVYTENKKGERQYLKSDALKQFTKPLVVLVNENSASASEILAGAIKDYKLGKLVGTTTYGKGLVQTVEGLSDGSALSVTTARYYTPSGNYIHAKGVEPDYEIQLPEELKYKSKLEEEEDVQLQKAIELINNDVGGF